MGRVFEAHRYKRWASKTRPTLRLHGRKGGISGSVLSHATEKGANHERAIQTARGGRCVDTCHERGRVRSALEGWRAARRGGGRFLLRLEDIDQARCRDEYAAAILEDVAWLGLDCTFMAFCEQAGGGNTLIEIEGFVPVNDPRLDRFRASLGPSLYRLLRFGSYAVPVRLHPEVTVDLPISMLGEGGVEVEVAPLPSDVHPEAEPETSADESGAES